MIASSLVLLASAATVLARNAPLGPANNYIAPVGLQIGTIKQNLTCTTYLQGLPVISNATFSLVLGGALANTVGRTQGYYLTGRAIVTSSLDYVNKSQKIGVQRIEGRLNSTVIIATGSSAGSYDVAKYKTVIVPAQDVKNNTPIVINIPQLSDTALQIGPITADATSNQIAIAIGSAQVNINATINGKVLPVQVRCPKPATLSYLAFTSVGGSGTKTVGPNADYPPVSSIGSGSVLGSAGLNYTCTLTGFANPFYVPVSLTTYGPKLNVTRGTTFQYLNSHGTINFTSAQVNQLQATLSSPATAFQVQITNLTATGTGINPTTVRVISSTVTSNTTAISSTKSVYSVDIPGQNGVLPAVTFTAGSTPGIAYIYLGQTNVNIIALNSAGATLKTFTGVCAAPASPKVPLLPISVI